MLTKRNNAGDAGDAGAPLVTVAVVTRDRRCSLCSTLQSIDSQDYPAVEVILLDDGSQDDTAAYVASSHPNVKLFRETTPQGYIAGRNRIALEARGAILFSLDDDSEFTRPSDIRTAVEYLLQNPRAAALTFALHEGVDAPPASLRSGCPRPIRSFVGCAHALRLTPFRELGMYLSRLEFYCEELDLSLRLLKRDYEVHFFPGVLIHHRIDWKTRYRESHGQPARSGVYPTDWRFKYHLRNEAIVLLLNLPAPEALIVVLGKLARALPRSIRLGCHRRWWEAVIELARWIPFIFKNRDPVSRVHLRRWWRWT